MSEPINREQRRARERGEKVDEVKAEAQERKLTDDATQQDVTDPRAKNSGHGKVTADKWNQ
jgi:hypothetical protein